MFFPHKMKQPLQVNHTIFVHCAAFKNILLIYDMIYETIEFTT